MRRMCAAAALILSALSLSNSVVAQQGPQVAFASNRSGRFQVWTVAPVASGAVQQVTTGGGGNQESREPDWAANGRIAYQFGASGVRGIHLIKPDGTGDVQLTTSGGDERDPSWSPDGRFIAYASQPPSGTDYDIWIHDTNNTPDDPSDDQDYVLLPRTGTQELRPSWSHDGNAIAFVASNQIAAVPVHLNPSSGRIEPNGSIVPLTSNGFINFDPTWSPDNQQIAYSTTRNGGKDIYRMSATLGESHQTQLTTNSANDSNPSWSFDGSSIAFVSDRDGNPEIYRMSAVNGEADTNSLVRITNDVSDDEDPSWQPVTGRGVDISRASGDVTDQQWQNMVSTGVRYVVVQGWGGITESPYASQQVIGAHNNGLLTGAYSLLNYFADGGTGGDQIEEAVSAVGSGMSNLKLMAVDVEQCCGEFVNWKPSTPYKCGALIQDPASHIQKVIKLNSGKPCNDKNSGKSGTTVTWNDSGGTTSDGGPTGITWMDTGRVVIDQAHRIQRICEAVAEVRKLTGVNVAIYTSRGGWKDVTGNAGNNKPCDLPPPNDNIVLNRIPLWDVQKGTFPGSDGVKHCGDGIADLTAGFANYPNSGWKGRLGKQYDLGPSKPPKPNDPCNGNAMFGISAYDVDLDFFDPSLFQ